MTAASIGISGSSELARRLASCLPDARLIKPEGETPALDMIVLPVGLPLPAQAIAESDDASWQRRFLDPLAEMRDAVRTVRHRLTSGGQFILIIPDRDVAGRAGFVAASALAEGARSLLKSAAAAWTDIGLVVTTVVIDGERLERDSGYLASHIAPLIQTLASAPAALAGSTINLAGAAALS